MAVQQSASGGAGFTLAVARAKPVTKCGVRVWVLWRAELTALRPAARFGRDPNTPLATTHPF